MENPKIDEEVMLGSSTAAHQIEGNLTNNWSEWAEENLDNPAGEAVNHYEKFEDDYEMASEIGHDVLRFSIAWSRIMPEPNTIDYNELEHYRRRVLCLKRNGIEPVISLWHFSHPTWFADQGEWVNGDTSKFDELVQVVVDYLGDLVDYWVTFNEPQGFCWMAYGRDWWPPELNSKIAYLKAERSMIKTHRRASSIINNNVADSKVGIAKSYIRFNSTNIFNRQISKLGKLLCNRHFVSLIEDDLDFIGVNYYFNKTPRIDGLEDPSTDEDRCPPYPSGLYSVIREAWENHKLPVIVTETGTADEHKREWYLINSLRAVQSARRDGIPVQGYLYWSLMDCFEWHSGWGMNFGLINVDRESQNRDIRDFARTFKQIADR